ncbi:hypothetical protein AB3S75_016358 [Citrus x aurantiifolia]
MRKYWSQRPPAVGTKRFHVKVKPLKLEGFCKDDDEIEKSMIVQMKWNGPKSSFVPFYRSKQIRNSTSERIFKNGDVSVEWDDEFESICDFSVVSKDGSLCPWHVSFSVLYRESAESKTNKMAIWGKASLNLAEMAADMESEVERKLPVTSKVAGAAPADATLLISVRFAEARNFNESSSPPPGPVQNTAVVESERSDAFFRKVMGFTGYKKKKKKTKSDQQASSCELDELAAADSDGSSGITNDNGHVEVSSGTDLGSSSGSETQADPVRKDGLLSWKRRRLSFRQSKKKGAPLIKKSSDNQVNDDVEADVDRQLNISSTSDSIISGALQNTEATETSSENDCGKWEMKELISRDGQTKLKANVFLASFDQRSEKAAGESACTALVAVVAHWLHSNPDFMPTKQEYDKLIAQGSSDWRMLCNNEAYTNFFPDRHFDLETVLEAGIHPITVLPDKSFTGFFSPEKFESLKGAMSFDEIWNEINNHSRDCQQPAAGVYIVSWNDHFFVLKVEANACYIIDSLGERLFEGCNQAYILKFDDSSMMYGKLPKEEAGSEESAKAEEEKAASRKEVEKLICSGKECCKEYIKRFLAAIPLGELEVEEKKGNVSTFCLHKRLQIDFHYSSCSSSATTSSLSSPAISSNFSLFSSEESN